MSFCKIAIVGNIGADAELRRTPSGQSVAQFNVAVNQSTKNPSSGEWIEATDWFRVSVWGARGERLAETLKKGNRVLVQGRFKTHEFAGRDGVKRTSMEITAEDVVSFEKRAAGEAGGSGFEGPRTSSESTPSAGSMLGDGGFEDELPF